MSQTDDGLTLDAVVKRFADSERALGEVHGKLQALASASASADSSALSLRETADAVRSFAENAASAAGELREVTTQARAVLEGGAAVLDGSALRAIEQRLEELARAVADSRESVEARFAELEETKARVARIDKGAETVYGSLPKRWRKVEYPGE